MYAKYKHIHVLQAIVYIHVCIAGTIAGQRFGPKHTIGGFKFGGMVHVHARRNKVGGF